jgi:hypothetical protein
MRDRSAGFMHFTLLTDGSAQAWVNDFGLTHAVASDPNFLVAGNYASGSFGIPLFAVLDRELRIQALGTNNDVSNLVASLLAQPAPSVDWPMP